MLRRWAQMKQQVFEECHAGHGKVTGHHVLETGDSEKGIRFIHDDSIEPNASIGVHPHETSEEVYYVLEGTGTMILDDEEYPVGPGDVCVCRPGHRHGIRNSSQAPMRLLVIGL